MLCPKCKEEKAVDELVFSPSGKARYCKDCGRSYEKKKRSRESHKVGRRIEASDRRNMARQYVVDFLIEHPCVDCGEKDIIVLDFDHLGDKIEDISDMIGHSRSLSIIIEEIKKCVVRCSNCHRRKTAIENGSYRVRTARGERIYTGKSISPFTHIVLNMEKAQAIRIEYEEDEKASYNTLAKKYDVNRSVIRDIVKNRIWVK